MENKLLRYILLILRYRIQISLYGLDHAFCIVRSGHLISSALELIDHINYLLYSKSINLIKSASYAKQDLT
jgi:hypothetical protein